ncbi:hypothetical protein CSB93_7027 (plasmid) [Pseudomonas paraeruginosa]|uniref:Uncharacterized protein n=1 Tax=Pseudomonas paraeruginosa TaxID=2994495 RepID=A0A2R3ILT6_9PSED|nr:hypothetical protein CSB93_7027 [Pseudomonas paraeruginosa]AWE88844.1 hypothetical protein CSC28_7047 [Pseudomonas paraeruginosa]
MNSGGDTFSSLQNLFDGNTGYLEIRLSFIHYRCDQAFF